MDWNRSWFQVYNLIKIGKPLLNTVFKKKDAIQISSLWLALSNPNLYNSIRESHDDVHALGKDLNLNIDQIILLSKGGTFAPSPTFYNSKENIIEQTKLKLYMDFKKAILVKS